MAFVITKCFSKSLLKWRIKRAEKKEKKTNVRRKSPRHSTYRDTEVVKEFVEHEFVRIVVLVRGEQFTKQFTVDVRVSSQVVWKTCRSFQTGKRALGRPINLAFPKDCNIQVGEFVFFEVYKTDTNVRFTATENFAGFLLRDRWFATSF